MLALFFGDLAAASVKVLEVLDEASDEALKVFDDASDKGLEVFAEASDKEEVLDEASDEALEVLDEVLELTSSFPPDFRYLPFFTLPVLEMDFTDVSRVLLNFPPLPPSTSPPLPSPPTSPPADAPRQVL